MTLTYDLANNAKGVLFQWSHNKNKKKNKKEASTRTNLYARSPTKDVRMKTKKRGENRVMGITFVNIYKTHIGWRIGHYFEWKFVLLDGVQTMQAAVA